MSIEVVQSPAEAGDDALTPSTLPEALPVLPLKETVAFPNTMTPLAVGQERSVQLVNDALGRDRMLVMVAARDPEIDQPGPDDLFRVGVAGTIARMLKMPDGTLRILVQGGQRVRIERFVAEQPYLVARIEEEPDVFEPSPELEALTRHIQTTFSSIIEGVPYLPEELQIAVANLDDPEALGYLIASSLRIRVEEKQELLEEADVTKRLRRLSEMLARETEVMELGSRIQSEVQSEMDRGQREYLLREQLKAIQRELGEEDESQAEVNELRRRMEEADLPEEVRTQAERELSRLEKLPPAAAEHGVIRTYLEWILDLPWNKSTEDNLDIAHARKVLDSDHYDIEKVKDRILDHLAVRKLKPDAKGSILSFVGPPGVGKTSLGQSIARALGRKFERISVGGVRDEAEIRGHRRTYIGAMPGTIVRALRDAGSDNPVFMIDEIDKMGADFRGDPASAMLEVLDPEQNSTFRDHYLDLPLDLSHVMFITTANILDTIPVALRDRMEVIQLSGYTAEEKHEIAKRYLVPRQIDRNGLNAPAGRDQARGDRPRDQRLHARGRGPQPRARDRHALPQGRARVRRGQGQAQGDGHGRQGPRDARAPALLLGDAQAHQGTRGRDRARLDAGGRRGAVRRGDRLPGHRSPDHHRAARRRHEGVRAGGAVVRARAQAAAPAEPPRRLVPAARPPHTRARRRDPEGRALRRRHDGDGAGVADLRATGCARTPP